MFRDTKEELARLERELLAEEENYAEEPEDDGFDAFLDDPDDFGEEHPGIYQNYSNGYGRKQPHNVYNADQTDEDLEAFSDTIQEPEHSDAGFIAVICFLLLAIAGVLLFCVLRYFL